MTVLKAAEIDRFVTNPPDGGAVVLVFGPDTGLVSERATRLVAKASEGDSDPFNLIKIDAADLSSDPNRLIDEVLTVPLFGGRRIVWVKDASGKNLNPALEPVLNLDDWETFVVLEGGDIKKGAGLRKLVETHKRAVALPCYADNDRGIDQLIDEETREAGLTITREARAALHSLLGGDRMASRGELKKLCLYALGKGRIDSEDIEAIIGDASAFEMSELIDAAASGDIATLDHGLERLSEAGSKASIIANQALKHFQQLHRMRIDVDKGKPAQAVIDGQRPPIFFSRKPKFSQQLRIWSLRDLERAMDILSDATRISRLNDPLGVPVLSEALLKLGRAARARNQRR
ncbi:DNA polymerase III subunit delta [Roseibium sp. MMSF_3544]|uniref:DNA polymerase III subunit delta n=1 Tax=unclassified Roseibium TaxID=2629323 RepID=UPI00273ED369|nr:DNA polymerase III subunit delta [Roseibium sp. MMSF_3544]